MGKNIPDPPRRPDALLRRRRCRALCSDLSPSTAPISTAPRSASSGEPPRANLPRTAVYAGRSRLDPPWKQGSVSYSSPFRALRPCRWNSGRSRGSSAPSSSSASPSSCTLPRALRFLPVQSYVQNCFCSEVLKGHDFIIHCLVLPECSMSDPKVTDTNEPESLENAQSEDGPDNMASLMPSYQEEEEAIKKKYGGLLPKKPPLISKDHERAFFDSADWALGNQGAPAEKPKGPLEALRPKLQPTHQQVRSRRSVYAPTESEDGTNPAPEDLNSSD